MAQDKSNKGGHVAQTRLNAELAQQYARAYAQPRKRAPGQSALTDELDELPPEPDEPQLAGPEAAELEAEAVDTEPKKSLFELPRREPARASLDPGGDEHGSESEGTTAAPVPPFTGGPTRRG